MFCIVTVPLVVAQQGRAMRPVLVVMWSDRCFLPPTHWPSGIRSHHRDVVHPPTYIGCCARGVRALTWQGTSDVDAHKHRIIRDTSNSNTSASEQDLGKRWAPQFYVRRVITAVHVHVRIDNTNYMHAYIYAS
jgi:hypothetical protein